MAKSALHKQETEALFQEGLKYFQPQTILPRATFSDDLVMVQWPAAPVPLDSRQVQANRGEIFLYSLGGEPLEISIKTPKGGDLSSYVLRDKNGRAVSEGQLPQDEAEHVLTVKVPAAGLYIFEYSPRGMWSYAVPAGRANTLTSKNQVELSYTLQGASGRNFFYVPRGTRKFQYFWGGREHNLYGPTVLATWRKYEQLLSWGKGQTLTILDDGADLSVPQWKTQLPWGPKVVATFNTVEGGTDPSPRPPGYHGTTVGYPSSLNHEGVLGVAYNNHVAHVRAVTVVHLKQDEATTIAAALQWVIENQQKYNITAVNLSPVDDKRHQEPAPTAIDEKLKTLRELNVWVSAPAGNNGFTDGISWPAAGEYCFAIGATLPGTREVHRDRWKNVDLLVVASYTSSSNAYATACSLILREAIEKANYDWKQDASTLPDAMMKIFQRTGHEVHDPAANLTFKELNLLAAVDYVFNTHR